MKDNGVSIAGEAAEILNPIVGYLVDVTPEGGDAVCCDCAIESCLDTIEASRVLEIRENDYDEGNELTCTFCGCAIKKENHHE